MADFLSPEWFDQAGKDIEQGAKDFGTALRDGPTQVMNDIANGDVVQGIWKAQDDVSQVIYDVLHPNNPDANWVVDQIETTLDQQPTPDDVAGEPDFSGPVPELPSPGFGYNDPDPVLPSPGPVFDGPAPELPSPVFKTFDSLTNVEPGLGGDDIQPTLLADDFLYNSEFVTSICNFDGKGLEELQGFVGDVNDALSCEINDLNELIAMVDTQVF